MKGADLTRGHYRRIFSGYIKGQRINQLTLAAEAWFWRLTVVADDFGNLDGDPHLIFSLTSGRRKITLKEVEGFVQELIKVELARFYEVRNEPYLHLVRFVDNQPGGKNGKRVRRVPESPWDQAELDALTARGESKKIQNNPDSSGRNKNQYTTKNKDQDQLVRNDLFKDAPFQSEEFLVALSLWVQGRKERRNPVTPTVLKLNYKKFLEWGEQESIKALLHSAEKGYIGCFQEKTYGTSGQGGQTATDQRSQRLRGRDYRSIASNSVGYGRRPPTKKK